MRAHNLDHKYVPIDGKKNIPIWRLVIGCIIVFVVTIAVIVIVKPNQSSQLIFRPTTSDGLGVTTYHSAIIIPSDDTFKDKLIGDIALSNSRYNVLPDFKSVEIIANSENDLNNFVEYYSNNNGYQIINKCLTLPSHHSKEFKPNFVPTVPVGFIPNKLSTLYGFPPASNIEEATTIGVIALGGTINIQEIKTYWLEVCGVPPASQANIVIVSADQTNTSPQLIGYEIENTIDVEIIGCVVPNPLLTIVLYHAEATLVGTYKAYNAAIYDTTYKPRVISTSWGIPEEFLGHTIVTIFDGMFSYAVSKGINIVAASGDFASSDGIFDSGAHVDFPSSSPNVIAIGGTTLYVNDDFTYSETAWSFNMSFNQGGGGGYSVYFERPDFQTGFHDSQFNAVPALALNSNPSTGIRVTFKGANYVFGGTSIAAPLFGAYLILNNVNTFVLPILYENPQAFKPIKTGTNGYYTIGLNTGIFDTYNVVCGLGSINGNFMNGII